MPICISVSNACTISAVEYCDITKVPVTLYAFFVKLIKAETGTAAVLAEKGVNTEIIYTIDANITYEFADFTVMPFKTMHDACEPFGFKFGFGDNVLSIATDFGIVTDELFKAIENTQVLTVESNYEDDLLKKNRKYPEYLKRRILSKKGHLSNKDAFYLIGELSKSGLKRCFLGHVSENNNNYDILEKYADACLNVYNVEAFVLKQKTRAVFNI